MTQVAAREKAHDLLDSVPPEHLPTLVGLLEILVPAHRVSVADVEYEDELISDEENAQAAAATGPGIPFEEILADYGLTMDGFLNKGTQASVSEEKH